MNKVKRKRHFHVNEEQTGQGDCITFPGNRKKEMHYILSARVIQIVLYSMEGRGIWNQHPNVYHEGRHPSTTEDQSFHLEFNFLRTKYSDLFVYGSFVIFSIQTGMVELGGCSPLHEFARIDSLSYLKLHVFIYLRKQEHSLTKNEIN